jgi:hypothetical protein
MSATMTAMKPPIPVPVPPAVPDSAQQTSGGGAKYYKGFVAGVFSGIAKLSGE